MVGYVKIEPGDSDTKITTALHMISDDDHHKVVSVKGVKNQKSVVEAFNGCEAPMITAQGIICGAVYRLER
jgi:hypothetical protein